MLLEELLKYTTAGVAQGETAVISFTTKQIVRSRKRSRNIGLAELEKMQWFFLLEKTMWMIWETTPANRFPERVESSYPYQTEFSEATANVPHNWKEIISQCVVKDPKERPRFENITKFFEEEPEPVAWRVKRKRMPSGIVPQTNIMKN